MAELDTLEVKIKAQAETATRALGNLNAKLQTLSGTLKNLDGNSLNTLASGVSKLGTAMQPMSAVKATDFNRIAKGIEKLASVNSSNLLTTAVGLEPLANSLTILGGVNFDGKNLANVATAINTLSNTNTASLTNINFENVGSQITRLTQSLAGASKVQTSTISLVNAMANLASAGNTMATTTSNMNTFGTAVKKLVSDMNTVSSVSENTSVFVSAVANLAKSGKSMSSATSNMAAFGNELKALLTNLSTAPAVSSNVVALTTALASFARTGSSGGRAASTLGTALKSAYSPSNKLTTSIGKLVKKTGSLQTSMKGLTSTITKAASKFKSFTSSLLSAFGVVGGLYTLVSGAKASIEYASDLVEVQNVVDSTYKDMAYKVEEFASTSIQQFGMSELSAKQYASTFQAMGNAMGIDSSVISSANTFLSSATDGYVGLSDSMSDVSLNLTKLTGDMASFYNLEQDAVAEDLAAIFTGQTVPLRSYGLDLTQATLSEWALKNGLDADISSMTQAEKTMLRYQYVMAQTTDAQSDFARTAGTWANQIRILKQQFQQLGSVVGTSLISALKPVVTWLNTVIAKLISFATTVSNSLGKIFGWKYETSDVSGVTSDYEAAADAADDLADSTGDAADAAKELQTTTLGIDELNINNPNDDSSGSGSSGSGSGSSGVGTGTGSTSAVGEWVKEELDYESELDTLEKLGTAIGQKLANAMARIDWDSIYEKARGFGTGLASFLNGLFANSDLFANLGTTIAGAINTALNASDAFASTLNFGAIGTNMQTGLINMLNGIDWNVATSSATAWAQGIADFLNGFITPEAFGAIGTTLSNSINSVIKSAQVFTNPETGFDFSNFGVSLGTLVNNALNIDWNSALTTIKQWGTGIATSINSFINTTDFETVGSTVGNALKGAVELALSIGTTFDAEAFGDSIADTVNGFFATFDFGELAETLNTWKDNLFDALEKAVDKINWHDVFQGLWDFLSHLDLGTITIIGVAIAWKSGVLSALGESAAKAIVKSISGKIASAGGWSGIATSIGSSISGAIASVGGIGGLLTTDIATIAGAGTAAEIGVTLGAGIFGGLAAAVGGWNLGHWIGEKLFGETDMSFVEEWAFIFQAAGEKIKEVWTSVKTWTSTKFSEMKQKVSDFKDGVVTKFTELKDSVKEKWTDIKTWASTKVGEMKQKVDDFKTDVGTKFTELKDGIEQKWTDVKDWFGTNVTDPLKSKFLDMKDNVKSKFEELKSDVEAEGLFGGVATWFGTNVTDPLKSKFSDMKTNVATKFRELKTNIEAKGLFGGVAEWFGNNVTSKIKSKFSDMKTNVKSNFETLKSDIEAKGLFGGIATWFKDNVGDKISGTFGDAKDAIETAWNKLPAGLKKTIVSAMNAVIGVIENALNGIIGAVNTFIRGINKVIQGAGSVVGQSWSGISELSKVSLTRIKTYETGGFPEDGLFMANHNELVGKFSNGRTAVANNEQIVSGIQYGVQTANEALIPYLIQIAQNTLNTANKDMTVQIGDRDIVNSYNRGSKRMGYSFTG